MVVRGTVQNGHVIPRQPLELHNGEQVYIVCTRPTSPLGRGLALERLRSRATAIALPDDAFATDSLYED